MWPANVERRGQRPDSTQIDTIVSLISRSPDDLSCPPAGFEHLSHLPEYLERLSQDPDSQVRQRAASSFSTPPGTLESLLSDVDSWVASTAAHNPNLPRAALALWQLAHPN